MTRYDVEHDIKDKNATTKIYMSLGISFHLLAFLASALLPRTIPQRELWSSTVTWTRSACGGPLGPWDERSSTKPFKELLKLTYSPQSWTFQAQKWMVGNCGGFSLSKWAFSGYMLNFRISQVHNVRPFKNWSNDQSLWPGDWWTAQRGAVDHLGKVLSCSKSRHQQLGMAF